MAEVVVGQRLGQLLPELGCLIITVRQSAERIENGRNVGLLQSDKGIPSEAWSLQFLCFLLLEDSTI